MMSAKFGGLVMLLGAASLTAGCASGAFGIGGSGLGVVTKVSQDSSYSRQRVNSAIAGRANVEVWGAPGGDPQAVADVLRTPGWFSPATFTAIAPSPETSDDHRFVLVFDAPPNVGGRDACEGLAEPGARNNQVLAVYCDGYEELSEARLSSSNLGDPRSPEFEGAMRGLFISLLPSRNPEDRSERDSNVWEPN
ncbi:MAG: hypothetical protein KTR21_18030 [Rhodobacteraceae bacterium]|nr:hypothetical protein [Paracoccaceae bacterium]